MDPPQTPGRLEPGTARWRALSALADTEHQAQWSAAQIAVRAGLSLEVALGALGWLREHRHAELKVWLGKESLYEITTAGREALAEGAQLRLTDAA
jgi:hypothetical protein